MTTDGTDLESGIIDLLGATRGKATKIATAGLDSVAKVQALLRALVEDMEAGAVPTARASKAIALAEKLSRVLLEDTAKADTMRAAKALAAKLAAVTAGYAPDGRADEDEQADKATRRRRAPRSRKARRTRSSHPGVVLQKRTWTRPDGSPGVAWRARFTDPDTKQVTRVTLEPAVAATAEARTAWAVTKAEALSKRRAELTAGAPRKTGTPLALALDGLNADGTSAGNVAPPGGGELPGFLAKIKATRRVATLRNYQTAVRRFLAWTTRNGIVSTDELDAGALARYREALVVAKRRAPVKRKGREGAEGSLRGRRAEGTTSISAVSANTNMRPVRAGLRYLSKNRLLAHLTRDEIQMVLTPEPEPSPKKAILREAQAVELLSACLRHDDATFGPEGSARHDPIAPFVAFVLLSGVRVGEALSLTWESVDFNAKGTDGRKVGEFTVTATACKTATERQVDLEVCPALRTMLVALRVRTGGKGYVFGGAEAWTDTVVGKARARLIDDYGAPKFTWQMLRRTAGTFLVNATGIMGGSTRQVADQLGHSVAVAEKHYLNRVRGISKKIDTLEGALGIAALVAQVTRSIASTGTALAAGAAS